MNSNPFTDTEPWVSPSLNKLRFTYQPGCPIPSSLRNQTGFDLLSNQSLIASIKAHHSQLRIGMECRDWIAAFERRHEDEHPEVRATARGISFARGQSLGYLLTLLHLATPGQYAPRQAWRDQHWRYWRAVRSVWVGGGQVSGASGPILIAGAREILRRHGIPVDVHLSPYGRLAPLVGAARHVPDTVSFALVADLGASSLKQGIARYEAGRLRGLESITVNGSPCGRPGINPSAVFARITADLHWMWRHAHDHGYSIAPWILVSIACYLKDDHPIPGQTGCFDRLQLLAPNLREHMSASLSRQLHQRVNVVLLHDGTAAAATVAGHPSTAFIVLGTSIGSGFPPCSQELRLVDQHFQCRSSG